jgi:Uma2 family endonuclease
VTVETSLMTFAEFEQLADPPSGHYELHHGQLIHMPPRRKLHFVVQQVIYDLLLPLLGTLSGTLSGTGGKLGVEFPFRPKPEYKAWQADVAFVSASRWKADNNDYFAGAPELVIEVLSKSNTQDEIPDRQAVCFSAGAWLSG